MQVPFFSPVDALSRGIQNAATLTGAINASRNITFAEARANANDQRSAFDVGLKVANSIGAAQERERKQQNTEAELGLRRDRLELDILKAQQSQQGRQSTQRSRDLRDRIAAGNFNNKQRDRQRASNASNATDDAFSDSFSSGSFVPPLPENGRGTTDSDGVTRLDDIPGVDASTGFFVGQGVLPGQSEPVIGSDEFGPEGSIIRQQIIADDTAKREALVGQSSSISSALDEIDKALSVPGIDQKDPRVVEARRRRNALTKQQSDIITGISDIDNNLSNSRLRDRVNDSLGKQLGVERKQQIINKPSSSQQKSNDNAEEQSERFAKLDNIRKKLQDTKLEDGTPALDRGISTEDFIQAASQDDMVKAFRDNVNTRNPSDKKKREKLLNEAEEAKSLAKSFSDNVVKKPTQQPDSVQTDSVQTESAPSKTSLQIDEVFNTLGL